MTRLELPNKAFGLFDEATLSLVEDNTGRILTEIGVDLKDDTESLDVLATAGGHVDGQRLKISGNLLREIITASAPNAFVQHARNPRRSILIGEGTPVFSPVYGPPKVRDREGRLKNGDVISYQAFVSLAQAASAIGNTGHMICVLNDVPEPKRHLEMARAHLLLSDKPFMGSIASPEALQDVVELTEAAFDYGSATDCRLLHLINPVPPLTYPSNPLKALRAAARAGQGVIVSSFMMLGATAPVGVPGALSQGLAEALVALALTQLYRPGTPVILGIYGIPFDMRSMLPRFGDPISQFIQNGSVQLARRLKIPALGYGGFTSSKTDDAQAGYEGAMATRAAVDAGADFIIHAAGWLENGRSACITKFRRESAALPISEDDSPEPTTLSEKTSVRFDDTLIALRAKWDTNSDGPSPRYRFN